MFGFGIRNGFMSNIFENRRVDGDNDFSQSTRNNEDKIIKNICMKIFELEEIFRLKI